MRKVWILSCVSIAAIFAANTAIANESLEKMSQNPKDWVMQSGNYANWRYSPLKQINADNVKNLQVAWTSEIIPCSAAS